MKLRPNEVKAEINDPLINDAENMVVHTPMGTTIKPAKFLLGDKVVTTQNVDANKVKIPEDVQLTVMSVLDNDKYILTGPNNLIIELDGAYLEKSEGGTVWGNL